MTDHIRKTIEEVQNKVRVSEEETARLKRMANELAGMAGMSAIYAQVESNETPSISSIRRDQWYGQPLATAIREFLEMRRAANIGPATVNEIFDALTTGGFKFETKDDDNSKRGLRISLTKNTSIFHRLPDKKHYGLLEWYPDVKDKKVKAKDTNGDGGDVADDDATDLDDDGESPEPVKEFKGF